MHSIWFSHQQPFLLIVQKNVKIKFLWQIPVFVYFSSVCSLCNASQIARIKWEQKENASNTVCTVVPHIIIIIIIIGGFYFHHLFRNSSSFKEYLPHNFYMTYCKTSASSTCYEIDLCQNWKYQKTVISGKIWFVWCKGAITTRGWCTCTGLTTVSIHESNECQICLRMTKSGTCDSSSEVRGTHWHCRLYLWFERTAEGFTTLNIFAERGKNFFVFVLFWKCLFRYLLYVSVTIHGL